MISSIVSLFSLGGGELVLDYGRHIGFVGKFFSQ